MFLFADRCLCCLISSIPGLFVCCLTNIINTFHRRPSIFQRLTMHRFRRYRAFSSTFSFSRALVFFVLFVIVIVDSSRVLELSDKFLEINKDGMWFVKFYAPWCGHCKKLEPVWNQVAQQLHASSVRVGRLDCTRYTSVANEYKVTGFPTILFIKDDHIYSFNGDRSKEDMVDFALRMAGPSVRRLQKYEDFVNIKKKHNLFFIYVGDTESPLWEVFTETAKTFQTSNYFYHTLPEVVQHEFKEENWPQIMVIKDGIYNKANVSKTENITATVFDWVTKERFLLFPKVSHGNFNQLLLTGKYLVLAILEENRVGSVTREMEKFRNMLNEVITNNKDKYHDQFQFGWLGQPEIANSVAMVLLPVPSLLVINSTTYQYFIPDDDPQQLTPDVLINFLDQIVNNTAPAYGGDSFFVRFYRAYFEAKTALTDMWRGNPVLTAVIFGLPLGFLSLICYSICCSDILEASEEEEILERSRRHAKKE